MKKQLLTFVLVPAIAFGSVSVALPKQAMAASAGQIVSSVSFRQSPDENSSRIRYLKAGESVTILEKTNNWWYKVQDQSGSVGYVSTSDKYIHASGSSSGSSAPSTPSQPAAGSGRIVSSVSFRAEANENSSRIRYLKAGETVQVLAKVNDWWYKVKASDGREGYVSTNSKYIQTSGAVSSGGSSGGGSSSGGMSVSEQVQKVIAAGQKYLGTPYEYSSSRANTNTFDCSDFVRQAFLDGIGLTLPSDSRGQGDYVKSKGSTTTNWKNLKPGDLMFFMDYKGTSASLYSAANKSKATISHVAIYLGDGKILHTYSKDSGGVRIDSIAGTHWEYRFLFGGSAL